jgi:outer membrane protein assembly factor BamB
MGSVEPRRGSVAPVWSRRLDIDQRRDIGAAAVTSPDGAIVVEVGTTAATHDTDQVVTAIDTTSGHRLWTLITGSPTMRERPTSVAISDDGSTAFVAGVSSASGVATWTLSALELDTGGEIWHVTWQPDEGTPLDPEAVLTIGDQVYIVGNVRIGEPGPDERFPAFALGYRAATGTPTWTARFSPKLWTRATRGALVHSAGTSEDGRALFLGLQIDAYPTQNSMGVLAIDPQTGRRLWWNQFASPTFEEGAHPYALTSSPDGSQVFIAGSFNVELRWVVAFNVSDGSLAWNAEVGGLGDGGFVEDIAVSSDGSVLVGVGELEERPLVFAIGTAAGRIRWTRSLRSEELVFEGSGRVAVAHDRVYAAIGRYRFIPGRSDSAGRTRQPGIRTVALDLDGGRRIWSDGYRTNGGQVVSIDQMTKHLVLCGSRVRRGTRSDLLCFAYRV